MRSAVLSWLWSAILLLALPCNCVSKTVHSCHPHSLKISPKVNHRPHKTVIAHRGASYHLPEHTLASYRTALSLGTDWIEPDVVSSADGDLWVLHTVDLNATTDVVQVFGDKKKPWFSPTVNRTGYWSFNFTSDELQQLRVRQLITGTGRSQMYNGIWKIPRLEEVLQVLNQWNQQDLPFTLLKKDAANVSKTPRERPTSLQLHQAGLYVELKDANWILNEADLNLVDALFRHFQEHDDLWRPLLQEQCFVIPRFDEYVVPGLVVQSFDLEALEDFHAKWPKFFRSELTQSEAETIDALNAANDPTTNEKDTGDEVRVLAPEPPYVLLVNHHGCTGLEGTEFWVRMGQSWKTLISGVGCDKKCLFDNPTFSAKAEEFKLVLHPWTQRPEQEFIVSTAGQTFETVFEETQYLLCQVEGVEGIFSEHVADAVMAAYIGCEEQSGLPTASPTLPPAPRSKHQNQSPELCYDDSSEAGLYTGLASFVMGVFIASFISFWVHRKRRRNYREGSAVPTGEDVANELEMT